MMLSIQWVGLKKCFRGQVHWGCGCSALEVLLARRNCLNGFLWKASMNDLPLQLYTEHLSLAVSKLS